MPIKKFYVKGNGEVIEVGLRPSLMALGSEYNLKVLARNLYEERKVEVIVSGADVDLQRFWRHVKEHDVRPVRDRRGYTVSRPELYEGPEPDWIYCASAFTAEQVFKGVSSIAEIGASLKGIDGKLGTGLKGINTALGQVGENFVKVSGRFGVLGKHVKEISDKLDDLPGRIARALKEGK